MKHDAKRMLEYLTYDQQKAWYCEVENVLHIPPQGGRVSAPCPDCGAPMIPYLLVVKREALALVGKQESAIDACRLYLKTGTPFARKALERALEELDEHPD